MKDYPTQSANSSEIQREKWRQEKRMQRARAAAKPLERFPSRFFEIMAYFERHQERAPEVTLAFDNETQAQSIKFTWYEFKKAIKAPNRQHSHTGWDSLCERILLRVKGRVLTWSWRDLDRMYDALNSLVLPEVLPAPSTQSTASPANTLTIPSSMIPPAADTESIYEAFAGKKPDPIQSPSDSTAGLTVEELMKREMGIED